MSINWFRPPTVTSGDPGRVRLEDYACRRALKLAGIPAGRVAAGAGLGPTATAKFTFAALRAAADFPALPYVSADPPDEVGKILSKFEKTRLHAAWLEYKDDRPDERDGSRVMVFKGPAWGLAAITDSPHDPGGPCLFIPRAPRRLLVFSFDRWLFEVGWLAAPPDAGREEF